jgi:hypothetical protein
MLILIQAHGTEPQVARHEPTLSRTREGCGSAAFERFGERVLCADQYWSALMTSPLEIEPRATQVNELTELLMK